MNNGQTNKINVPELKKLLLKLKIMQGVSDFPYNYSYKQTCDMLTAATMAEVESRRHKYIELAETDNYIQQASKWLCERNTFGLMLCGNLGNGKSTIANGIATLINYLKLKNQYGDIIYADKLDAVQAVKLCKQEPDKFEQMKRSKFLVLDDLGIEPTEVMDYGNILSPVIELLTYRYNEQLITIVTTNLIPKQIREKYGDRVADRFNEMFSKIIFTNKSFRKQ